MQVYKEIKILSARPNEDTVKHHLYGFVSVNKTFLTGDWIKQSYQKIKDINEKGKIAFVVGGTGLYFKTLTDGFSYILSVPKPKKNFYLNKSYILRFPKIFKGVSINDKQRLQRAFLVYKYTGKPLHIWQKRNKKFFKSEEITKILLSPPKFELENRIKKDFLKC